MYDVASEHLSARLHERVVLCGFEEVVERLRETRFQGGLEVAEGARELCEGGRGIRIAHRCNRAARSGLLKGEEKLISFPLSHFPRIR
jgi:hypothetical protein